ncbi:unnamed protein product [Heligmosomoides polygyrus]|uniref:Uncharacterized protein n=1 Tax=Heligmosomoides polygyrus TaxID=6339 RepID=A0A3P8IH24_HELPZ|nr:unnamed protein product [Heligmosomoides polygyrus]
MRGDVLPRRIRAVQEGTQQAASYVHHRQRQTPAETVCSMRRHR